MKPLAAVLAGVLGAASLAQQPAPSAGPADTGADTRIVLDVTRVNVLFTVTDKKGRFVTDLAQSDFKVLENKKPQSITEFTCRNGSAAAARHPGGYQQQHTGPLPVQQEAAVEFVNSVVRPRQDRAMVVSFDTFDRTRCRSQ